MLALFILASITRCVSAQLCPTDANILAAVRQRDDETTYAMSVEALKEHPNEIIFVHAERIRSIRDVICGDALPAAPPTVTCKFTVRYWSRNGYQVARFRREGGDWRIDDALCVMRER